MKKHHQIFLSNYVRSGVYSDDSFTGDLHELWVWNVEKYWQMEWALVELTKECSGDQIPRHIALAAHWIGHWIEFSIGCHLDPNDQYIIEGMDGESLHEWRQRSEIFFYKFFRGEVFSKMDIFKLTNPLL